MVQAIDNRLNIREEAPTQDKAARKQNRSKSRKNREDREARPKRTAEEKAEGKRKWHESRALIISKPE